MVRIVPPQTVAAHQVLRAVRHCLAEVPPGPVLVACSGGSDSLALAAATADVAVVSGREAGAVVVDHGLQDDSADVASVAAQQCADLGLSPVTVGRAEISLGTDGPEATARSARYEALDSAARLHGAVAVLLGHSMNDQAESVLLGLVRGSGNRSLAGMPPTRGRYVRPLLGVSRETMLQACEHWGLLPWIDPHNSDPTYTRVRVRDEVIPVLESQLGPGIVPALVRTARIARSDSDALDQWAAAELGRSMTEPSGAVGSGETGPGGIREVGVNGLDVRHLATLPFAIRTRVLKSWLVSEGCPGSRLTAEHIWSVARLVDHWRGQGQLSVPGGLVVWRRYDTLHVGPIDRPTSSRRKQPVSQGDRQLMSEDEAGRPMTESDQLEMERGGSELMAHLSGPRSGEAATQTDGLGSNRVELEEM
jgi:tRNA(Ile)-lysidine synthase